MLTESNSLGITSNIISPSLHVAGAAPAAPAPSLLSSEWEVPLFDSNASTGPHARPSGADSPPKKKPRPKQ